MIRFLIRRLISGLIVLFIFVSAVFFVVQIILPGDYVSQFALMLTPDQAEAYRHQLGLDLPIWQGYVNWLKNLVHGDLGSVYNYGDRQGTPITYILKTAISPSILVFGIGTVIAFLLGQWLGKLSAWRGPGLVTSAITFSSITLYTSFPPWLAFLAVYFLVTRLGIFPLGFNTMLWREAPFSPPMVMWTMVINFSLILLGLFILNAIVRRLFHKPLPDLVRLILLLVAWFGSFYWKNITPYAFDILKNAAIPLFTYVMLSFGEIMLLMRTTMVDVMHEDYILTARAKGLTDKSIRDRHAARNALLPVLSGLVIRLPYLLTGTAMIEDSLHWEGIGSTFFYAIGRQNITLVVGLAIIFGVISLGARIILDIIYAYLDPRIRYDTRLIGRIL